MQIGINELRILLSLWILFKQIEINLDANIPNRSLPVNSQAVDKVKHAIEEFVQYVQANEPGTHIYISWQQKDDKTRFVHFFIFENEEAQTIHSKSQVVKRFESIYSPELVDGDVIFIDYDLVAANDDTITKR